ncbi:MAG: VOC family protein [Treponema sp.]|jgi:lactoylglutathione lyase|nr:VOC family protein [Treponema sp.]
MFKGLGHVAVRARDIEASAKFYTEVIGFKEAFRMNNLEGGKLGMIYLYTAPSQFIEIFPNGGGELTDNNTIGLKHICIEVDNAAQFQEELRARGAPIDTELKTGHSKCIQFWTHDPDGNRIEFMELPPESLQAQANKRLHQI